ncbi:voltage-dependent calcium channel type A subunit alpha-1-like [Teleopsis dalmanni]|nr:voltage-dependent calcium channel type A subunit alpha-1-like [Teleopsis dalmanni]
MYYSSRERDRDRERYRDRMRDYDLRYEYRDREREMYERERDRERELERERLEYIAPLSFEQALAMGRTGRVLPSPVLNGYKPKGGLHARHSDSDEEDWC